LSRNKPQQGDLTQSKGIYFVTMSGWLYIMHLLICNIKTVTVIFIWDNVLLSWVARWHQM